MRKFASIPPLAALALGAVGFFLRRRALLTAFDDAGLQIAGSRSASIFLLYTAAAALVCVVLAAVLTAARRAESEYIRAFSPSAGFFSLAVNLILAIALLTAGFLLTMQLRSAAALGALQLILLVLTVLSAVSLVVLPVAAYRGRSGAGVRIFSVMPPLFFCAWLIVYYRGNSANPALLDFGPQCVAIAAAALATYFAAGFAFGKPARFFYPLFSLLAILLCAMSCADVLGTPYLIFHAVTAVALTLNASVFFSNLRAKQRSA